MSGMNYSTNHSRNLSSHRRYYGDEPVHVKCVLCTVHVLADGVHALRAKLDRGVKARIGYRGPAQTWVCRECAEDFGTAIALEQIDALFPATSLWTAESADLIPFRPRDTDLEEDEQRPPPNASSVWKWAFAAGAAALIGWAAVR